MSAMTIGDRLFSANRNRFGRLSAWFVVTPCLALAFSADACRSVEKPAKQQQADWAPLAQRYRETHDYKSLVALLPLLEIRTTRRDDVEKLLGPPVYSPTPFQSYYPTDRSVPVEFEAEDQAASDGAAPRRPMEFQIILVVQYLERGPDASPSDALDAFSLGPVGE